MCLLQMKMLLQTTLSVWHYEHFNGVGAHLRHVLYQQLRHVRGGSVNKAETCNRQEWEGVCYPNFVYTFGK
jgi:hypothetical protein